ncbi:MAG: hypothetical protein ACK53Y_12380, partial [bacterium]
SKQRSRSEVSRLNGKKGGDIQAYPVEAHTEQGPDNKAYLGGTPRPRLSRQTHTTNHKTQNERTKPKKKNIREL